jgi:hypothetical protein
VDGMLLLSVMDVSLLIYRVPRNDYLLGGMGHQNSCSNTLYDGTVALRNPRITQYGTPPVPFQAVAFMEFGKDIADTRLSEYCGCATSIETVHTGPLGRAPSTAEKTRYV